MGFWVITCGFRVRVRFLKTSTGRVMGRVGPPVGTHNLTRREAYVERVLALPVQSLRDDSPGSIGAVYRGRPYKHSGRANSSIRECTEVKHIKTVTPHHFHI
jgi:hypothetical protein